MGSNQHRSTGDLYITTVVAPHPVFRREGDEVHALRDECSHASLSLSEGEVTRKGIECWLHGSCFDLRTGQPSSPPATEPVDVYAVRIDGDDVFVDPDTTLN